MSVRTIVIIEHESLSVRKKENYLIDEFIHRGYNVEYWDCSQYFFPGISFGAVLSENYCHSIKTEDDLKFNLTRINKDEAVFVVEVFYAWNNRHFFHILKKNGCYLVKIEMYSTANVRYLTLLDKLKQISIKKIFSICRNRIESVLFSIYCKLTDIRYNVTIGSGAYRNFDYFINHPDWELYKKMCNTANSSSEKYAVFLDEYFPLHPDLKYYCNFDINCEVEYRQSLNNYFKLVEESLGLKVIIAAHPKSSYDDNTFEGRTIIRNNTVSLVKDAQLVIMHSSAALSFVIMFNKPLILITTRDYLKSEHLKNNQLSIAKFLNKNIVNINATTTFDNSYTENIAPDIRKKYIHDYLSIESTQMRNNKDLLIEIFEALQIS